MAVIIWEEPVAVGNIYWPVEVTFTICVRLVPNIGGVLKGVQISVVLGLETINAVLALSAVVKFEITVLRLEMPELVQDAGEPVIRMIPEPTSPSY